MRRLAGAQQLREGGLAQADLAAVGAAEGQDLQCLLDGAPRRAQALHDPPRLAVERHRVAGLRIEHRDADRGDLDQGFEIGPCAALVAVGAGVGDRGRGLCREQHQHLLVLVGELRTGLLLAEEEVADLHAAVAHRRTLESVDDHPVGGEAQPGNVGAHVRQPHRCGQIAQHLEDVHAVRPRRDLPFLLGREAGEDGIFQLPGGVDGGDDAVAGSSQGAGGLGGLAQHGVDVEARADAQDGRGERGIAFAQGLDLAFGSGGVGHWFLLPGPGTGRRSVKPSTARAGAFDCRRVNSVLRAYPF